MFMDKKAPRFRYYDQNQLSLLPHSLEDFIVALHPARIVNSVIDQLDLENLYKSCSNYGGTSYHLRMLLKVLIYAYLNNIYSSRKIEQSCLQNIHYK